MNSCTRVFCWLICEENVSPNVLTSIVVRCKSEARYSTLLLAVVSSTSLKATLAAVSSPEAVQKTTSSTRPFIAAWGSLKSLSRSLAASPTEESEICRADDFRDSSISRLPIAKILDLSVIESSDRVKSY